MKYQPKNFEKKWREIWEKEEIYKTPKIGEKDKKKKIYALSMFPYPSGSGLHVGHVRVYTGTDVLARFFRMKGYNVLHPMGWDAFGLPAENAAIKAKKNPLDLVPKNIANFKNQMKNLGLSYDWSREFATTDPDYYGITQALFITFFKLGLLYKKKMPVYFCPFCKTGLAEEEVLPDGTHERCGHRIERRYLPQWVFRITTYAESLLKGLEKLDWPQGILEMQKNWIGKQKGLEIRFKVEDGEEIAVWTKFWETVFGSTFLVVAPEHWWVRKMMKKKKFSQQVKEYVELSLSKTDEQRLKEKDKKTGVFTGYYAINQVNGKRIPIWIADYVLGDVGTGAVMGVPAHDERDFAFAKKYNLPIIQVVSYSDEKVDEEVKKGKRSFGGEGRLVNSGQFNGLSAWKEGKKKMAEWMIKKGIANWRVHYHLRDWIFSRQRYWGEPIPLVYCKHCADSKISWFDTQEGKKFLKKYHNISKIDKTIKENLYGWFPVKEEDLPVKLPYLKYYKPTDTGKSPLANVGRWVKTKCPVCGREAKRETDTMPNWAGSSWYFLRFAQDPVLKDKKYDAESIFRSEKKNMDYWLPVDWYLGGAEHAVLHLLYSRFWVHVLNDMGLVKAREPFKRLRNVGMVLAPDHKKMSKSKGNVVNPDDVIKEYGADALRIYEMFMAPFSQEIAWSISTLQGSYRFLKRVWQIYNNSDSLTDDVSQEDKSIVMKLNDTILKVEADITDVKFNTAIAAMMKFLNYWEKSVQKGKKISKLSAEKFLKILSPFAPFITEELWRGVLKKKTSIHLSQWPKVAEVKVDEVRIKIPVQVNGKLRGVVEVVKGSGESEVVREATKIEKVAKYLKGREYKVVFVKDRVLNFVFR